MNGFYVSEEVSFSSLFATPVSKNIKSNQLKTLKKILKTNFDENRLTKSDKPKHVFFNEKIQVIWGCGESSDEILNDTKCSLSLHRSPLKRLLNKRFWSFKRSKKQTKHSDEEQEEEEDDEELYIVDDLEANVPIVVLKRNIDCFKCNVTAPLATMDDLGVFENFSDEEDDGGWIDGIDEESDNDDTITNNELIKNNIDDFYKENVKENIIKNLDKNFNSLFENKTQNEQELLIKNKDKGFKNDEDCCDNNNNELYINNLEMISTSVHETIPSEVTKDINNNKVLHSLVNKVDTNFNNNINKVNNQNKNYFITSEINNSNVINKINNSIEQLLAKDIENKRILKNKIINKDSNQIDDVALLPDDVAIIYNENFKADTNNYNFLKNDINSIINANNNKNISKNNTVDTIRNYDDVDMMKKDETSCYYKVNSNVVQNVINNNDKDCLLSSIESIEKCVYDIQIKEVDIDKISDKINYDNINENITGKNNAENDDLYKNDKELLIEIDDDNYCVCPSYTKETNFNIYNKTGNINSNFDDFNNDIKTNVCKDIDKAQSLADIINNNNTSHIKNDEANEKIENNNDKNIVDNKNANNIYDNVNLKDFSHKDDAKMNSNKGDNNSNDDAPSMDDFNHEVNIKYNKINDNGNKLTKYQKEVKNIYTKNQMATSAKDRHKKKKNSILFEINRQNGKIAENNVKKLNERLFDEQNIKVNGRITRKTEERMKRIKEKSLIIKKENNERKEKNKKTNEKQKLSNYDNKNNNINDRRNKMNKRQKSPQDKEKETREKGMAETLLDFPQSSSFQLRKSLVWTFHQDNHNNDNNDRI